MRRPREARPHSCATGKGRGGLRKAGLGAERPRVRRPERWSAAARKSARPPQRLRVDAEYLSPPWGTAQRAGGTNA